MRSVCNIRPHKIETRRRRLTAGVNIIGYPGEVRTPKSDLTTMKIHVNSFISDIQSIYISMDVKYFYLNNQMDISKYITVKISMIPQELLEKYKLK